MTVRRIGTWKDAVRRASDAAIACLLPGGLSIASILAHVDGYLFPHEGVFLYWLARSGPGSGSIVEIGSFRGRSTLCMAEGVRGRRETRIFAIDPHVYGTADELRENIAHFDAGSLIEPRVLPSVDAARSWGEPVRLVFVDGNHERASVEADIDAWVPHLVPGGFLLVHDSTSVSGHPGPTEVARERLRIGPLFDAVGQLGAITWARRPGASSWLPPAYGKAILDPCIRTLKGRRS